MTLRLSPQFVRPHSRTLGSFRLLSRIVRAAILVNLRRLPAASLCMRAFFPCCIAASRILHQLRPWILYFHTVLQICQLTLKDRISECPRSIALEGVLQLWSTRHCRSLNKGTCTEYHTLIKQNLHSEHVKSEHHLHSPIEGSLAQLPPGDCGRGVPGDGEFVKLGSKLIGELGFSQAT